MISIVGGLSELKQQRLLKRRPEIVVATPGRLWALMNSGDSDQLRDMSRLRCLIVDETDRMVEHGHFEELEHILEFAQRFPFRCFEYLLSVSAVRRLKLWFSRQLSPLCIHLQSGQRSARVIHR